MTSHVVTIAVFAAIGVAMLVLDLLARFTPLPVPTLSAVMRQVMRRRSAQIGVVMAWWWIGWHFFVG